MLDFVERHGEIGPHCAQVPSGYHLPLLAIDHGDTVDETMMIECARVFVQLFEHEVS
jgi:hypothetical protein